MFCGNPRKTALDAQKSGKAAVACAAANNAERKKSTFVWYRVSIPDGYIVVKRRFDRCVRKSLARGGEMRYTV
jgi:hypothetical protein